MFGDLSKPDRKSRAVESFVFTKVSFIRFGKDW